MSYYTVNTTNAFAALDMSDDEDRILTVESAPKKVEEPTPTPAPAARKETARRGGNRGRGGRKDTRDGADVDESQAAEERNTRGRRPTNARRGGRGDTYQPREGKKVFDKKTDAKKPTEDVDPAHAEHEQAAADQIVAEEVVVSEEERVFEDKAPVEKRFTIKQFLASQKEERIVIDATETTVESYTDLNREIVDAGFKAVVKSVEEQGGRAPGASRQGKAARATAAADLFATIGAKAPSMRPVDSRREKPERPERKQKTESDAVPVKVKDEAEFPSLC